MEHDRYLTVRRDCQLHYRIDKHAEAQVAVVLLHGLSSNLTRWTEFLQQSALQKHWTTLRMDLRGHGESRFRGMLNTATWAADLHRILAAENIRQVVIVGHSLGARVAAEYARCYPERCNGIVLLDPVVPEALQGRGLRLYRLRFLIKAVINLVRLANALGIYRRHIPLRDLCELDKRTRQLLATQSHATIAKQYMSPRIDLRFNPLVIYLQDLLETLTAFPDILQSAVPVHILLSSGGSISDMAQLEEYFVQGRNVSIEHLEADHWPLTEKPVQTRQAIEHAVGVILST